MAECPNTPPRKKLKGIPTKQKYKVEYAHKWPVLQKSKISGNHVYCQMCRANINIGHSGLYDCRKHIESMRHVHTTGKACSKINTFFSKDTKFATINAEMLFTSFLIEHNIPIAVGHHSGPRFKRMFPDSKIATQYASGQKKTTAIVETLAKECDDNISTILEKGPNSIAADASTDMESITLFPRVVKYFDSKQGKVMCMLLCLVESSEPSTGKFFFELWNMLWKNKALLSKIALVWEQCQCQCQCNAGATQGSCCICEADSA